MESVSCSTDPMNRTNPMYKFGIMLFVSLGMQMACSELVKSEDWNSRADGAKKPSKNVIGVPWRMTDGRWTVDRNSSGPDPNPAIAI